MFSLQAHPDSPSPDISIAAEAARTNDGMFVIRYVVDGAVDQIAVSQWVPYASRQNELWMHSCFEAFVAAEGTANYLEFNFSPSTGWAAYRFSSYRHGGGDLDMPAPYFDVERPSGRLEVTVALDVTDVPDAPIDADWRLGLSAVIETMNGNKSYWALAHPPGAPDFHHPACFAARLPAPERP